MKNVIKVLLLVLSSNVFAQVAPPQAFSYSGVARDAQNLPIANQTIGIQFGILKTSPTGTVVYQENHFTNTDPSGLFTLDVGTGAVQQGVFADIEWGSDNFYLRVGLDASGNTNFQVVGTTQLLSVPYALYAKNSGSNLHDNDTSATNEIQTLSLNGNTLSLSNGGGSVTLPSSSGTNPVAIQEVAVAYSSGANQNITFECMTYDPINQDIYLAARQGAIIKLSKDILSGVYYSSSFTNPGIGQVITRGMSILNNELYVFYTQAGQTGVYLSKINLNNSQITHLTFTGSTPPSTGPIFNDGTYIYFYNNRIVNWQKYAVNPTNLVDNGVSVFNLPSQAKFTIYDGSIISFVNGNRIIKNNLNGALISNSLIPTINNYALDGNTTTLGFVRLSTDLLYLLSISESIGKTSTGIPNQFLYKVYLHPITNP